jgi:hypothetical protein
LLYPANLNAHKNRETLLIAWARFPDRERMPLVFVGEYTQALRPDWELRRSTYWLHDHLFGLVRRIGLQYGPDFYALGYVSDGQMEHIMRGAWGMIMPSLSEGGGSYPVEEALTYGIPFGVTSEHMSSIGMIYPTRRLWSGPRSAWPSLLFLESRRVFRILSTCLPILSAGLRFSRFKG